MAENVEFIDCTSLSISYDVYGIATVSFTIVSNSSGLKTRTSITAGGKTFDGYVTSATVTQIPNTKWYLSNVTLVATSN
jgi:hypothetical protein